MVQKICIRSYVLVVTLTFADYYYLAQRINSIQRKPETKATPKLSVNSSNKIDLYLTSVKCITHKKWSRGMQNIVT